MKTVIVINCSSVMEYIIKVETINYITAETRDHVVKWFIVFFVFFPPPDSFLGPAKFITEFCYLSTLMLSCCTDRSASCIDTLNITERSFSKPLKQASVPNKSGAMLFSCHLCASE